MKTLFVLILSLVISGSIFAQGGDRVLADGNPPLMQSTVDQLIDFFEFGLHGKFTPQQRAQFQQQQIASWQDAKERENAATIVDMRSKLMGLDDQKLVQAQSTIEKYLVGEIEKQPNDPTSKILKQVYESGKLSAVSSGPITASVNSGGDVSALLGTWGTGSVSAVNYTNSVTGSSTNGGGTQVQYTFKPGGRYEYASLTTSTLYNCSMKFGTYKAGIVSIQGGVLTFVPQTATFTSEDSCVAKNNYKKPADLNRETFNWSIQRDEYGTKLCLQNQSINGCAYKR